MASLKVSDYPIDYAFVCIDQLTDGDSARQDAVYRAVTEAGVPFIDSGVSITFEDCAVSRDCPDQTDSSNHVTLWDGSNYKMAA